MSLLDSEIGAVPVHLALARKWRPQRFADVIGQQQTLAVLTGALATKRVHHALMFTGIRGVGKTTLARIFAKALNCAEPDGAEPCCACSSCAQVDAGSHPDMIEIDAASTTQVDSMRELLDSARYAPALGKYKVYIIDEVHMLSRHSFNAMLKTLEEPPEHVKFVLATTDPQQVPATVQSRCMRLALRRLPVATLVDGLTKIMQAEQQFCTPEALKVIAAAADGSMRDALSILDEALSGGDLSVEKLRELVGIAGGDTLEQLLKAVLDGDTQLTLKYATELHQNGVMADSCLAELIRLVHQKQIDGLEQSAPPHDPLRMQVVYEIAAQSLERMSYALTDPQVVFEMALLRMIALFNETSSRATTQTSTAPSAAPASSAPSRTTAALPDNNEQWQQLCERLGAVAKVLAGHCVFSRRADGKLYLELAAAHKTHRRYQAKLEQELGKIYGQQVTVEIALVEQIDQETPKQTDVRHAKQVDQQAMQQAQNSPEFAEVKKRAPASKVVAIEPERES